MHNHHSTHWLIQSSDTDERRAFAATPSAFSILPAPPARPHTAGTPAHRRHAHTLTARPHTADTPAQHRHTCSEKARLYTTVTSAHGWHLRTPPVHRVVAGTPPARRRHSCTPPARPHIAGSRLHHRHVRRLPAHLLAIGTLDDRRPTHLAPARSSTNRSPTTRRLPRKPPAFLPTSAFPSMRSNLRGTARPLEHPRTAGTCSNIGLDCGRRRQPPTSVHVSSSYSGECDVGRGGMPSFSYCTAAHCGAAVLDVSVWMVLPLLI